MTGTAALARGMDWHEMFPDAHHLARAQIAWERRHSMLIAREGGADIADIAHAHTISASRVHGMLKLARQERRDGVIPPIVLYLTDLPLREHRNAYRLCRGPRTSPLSPEEIRERLVDLASRSAA